MRLSGLLMACLALLVLAPAASAANPIATENAHPGDSDWQAALSADVTFGKPPIEGYAGATSVLPGGTIDFHVSVRRPGDVRTEIVRLGWYAGAGGRRLTCLTGSALDPTCATAQPGVEQPAAPAPDPATGEVQANWSVTNELHVPSSWVSGYYLAIFRLTSGQYAGYTGFAPFIVESPPGERSQILVQVPTNTWQAYNTWGGEDVYGSPRAVKVSFNRPYHHRLLFDWEYPLVRFLERGGYDVSYVTDDAVDRDPQILLGHKLDIFAGHGEYWTHTERDAWEAARGHGVNLAFTGANTGYWQVRYEDSDRTMVSYKYTPDPEPDPALKTIQFRDLRSPRPECQLEGEQYNTNDTSSEAGHYFSYKVTAAGARDPWLAGTGLRAGSAIPGVVGFEFDAAKRRCRVPPVTTLLHFHARPYTADAVRYRACSGAEVFDAGSLLFSFGLDGFRSPDFVPPTWPAPPGPSAALQRIMSNAIADMLISHPRFTTAHAVHVVRGGRWLRIEPGVRGATVSVRGRAVRVVGDGRVAYGRSWRATGRLFRVPLPRGAVAELVDVSARTGDVVDTRHYIVVAHGRLRGPATELASSTCYGRSARVLTPVFGSADGRPLKIAVRLPGPVTVSVLRGRHVLASVRTRRRTVSIPAAQLGAGEVSVRVRGRGRTFRLAALGISP